MACYTAVQKRPMRQLKTRDGFNDSSDLLDITSLARLSSLLFCSVLFLLRIRSRPKRRILRQFVTTAQHMIQPAAAAAAAASISQSRLDFGARARQVVQRRMRNVEEPTDRLSVQMSRCECQCNLGPRDNIWRHCSIEPLHWKFE